MRLTLPTKTGGRVALLFAAALALGLTAWLGRSARGFELGSLVIDPAARIHLQCQYTLVVWDHALPVTWSAITYEQALQRAIADFRQMYPNAQVRYALLEPGEGDERMAAALAAGTPPDVYGALRPARVHPALQVPTGPYLAPRPRERPPEFHPFAWEAVSREGRAWGWPRWIEWEAWLAHPDLLAQGGLDPERVVVDGWTWDAAVRWAERVRGRVQPLALQVEDHATLLHLMANNGAPELLDARGELLWNEESLGRLAEVVGALQRMGAVPRRAGDMSRTRIARFARREAAVIGPVNAWAARTLLADSSDQKGILVPIPHHPQAPELAPFSVSAYLVFRQQRYQGDDQTRLAMELARFLARRMGAWVSAELGVLPAAGDDLAVWEAEGPWAPVHRTFLLDYLLHAPPRPLFSAPVPRPEVDEVMISTWRALWEGDASPDQFTRDLADALRQLLGSQQDSAGAD